MAIRVQCESCFHSFSVGEQHAGKRGKCPSCKSPVRVPSASGGDELGDYGAYRPAERPQRSRRKKSTGNSKALWISLGVGGGVLVLLLFAVTLFLLLRSDGPAPAQPALTNAPGSTAPRSTANPANTTVAAANVNPVAPGAAGFNNGTSLQTTANRRPAVPELTVASGGDVDDEDAKVSEDGAPKRFASVADLIEVVEPSVVRLDVSTQQGRSTGSGFVVDKEGTIVTNYHVIAGATGARAVFPDDTQARVEGVLNFSKTLDVAVLKINLAPESLHPVRLAETMPRKGEIVVALGCPLGLDFSASEGKVAAMRDSRDLTKLGRPTSQGTWLQTTAPISPGNSGGPLFNMRGEVVAANTMMISGGGAQNLNFGISSKDIAELVRAKKKLRRLSPREFPPLQEQPSAGTLVDGTKTAEGRRLLAGITDIYMADIEFSLDPSGQVNDYVVQSAESAAEEAGMSPTRNPLANARALMITTMRLKRYPGRRGARKLEISAHVLVREDLPGGGARVVKVWEDEQEVGSFSESSLVQGRIPTRVRSEVQSFFNKFRTAHSAATKELEDGSKKKADGREKDA